ncbi:DUF4862 family protein [Pseudenterobacter timonensis]|uniref:DUF4862 family protein n=1 Tax=Pseudenterobacter timonensis TaxID=1755099 RepID=A0ABV4ACX8_9ENTR
MTSADFIIGAYPCAPSFHQQGEEEERAFWRELADTPHVRGLEQPCLEDLHPYGDEWLFRHTPGDWQLVVTAVMETMRRRGANGGFGLASADEEQRKACVDFYRHLHQKITAINARFPGRAIALEMQAAPQAGNASVDQATEAFSRSIREIAGWDWSCDLVLEHCDSMTGVAPRKGFLPLERVLEVLKGTGIGVCINWARSAIEGRNVALPVEHVRAALEAGKLDALMFSGTSTTGEYGEWQDLHAPFSSFCADSLLSAEQAKTLFTAASAATLKFSGIKLLEIDANASVSHRIAILRDGISAMKKAIR